ncbi:heparinase II/III family protein [Abyssibius alkaniclasticus]|uniref:heparinase II/III family protein n=1 Tax=Abyssibius alkaniclasticus TaxID=2881234 RepID=UPI00236399DD|nr:heparinase II/III family protein [Abyssibius alkaniclasticus]UPH72025.1 heparinase II/III family protein [Abyssibius alkaniclasticus]
MAHKHVSTASPNRNGLRNKLAARLAALGRAPRVFSYHLEPRSIGSYAVGRQLMSGNFLFAGQLVEAPGSSIWAIDPPSEDFAAALQGFGWLDDLAAVGDAPARKLAQRWLFEWIATAGAGKGEGWRPDLAGRRLIRWCSHALFILKGLSPAQSRSIFRALGRQVRYLRRRWPSAAPGQERFEALTGLLYAGISLDGCAPLVAPISATIGRECERVIDAHGGLPTRNPEALMESFVLLTWAARTLAEARRVVDKRHQAALLRMAPTLRGLRLGDGALARFHGGRRGEPGRLDQALADASLRPVPRQENLMGFERLSAGRLTIVMDCAPPPKGALGINAHASTLGFEMSSGRRPILMNCGAGGRFGADWRRACRATAAHNTVALERVSSSTIGAGNHGQLVAGPQNVDVTRAQDMSGTWLAASHDGYAASFGLKHERRLFLSFDGRSFKGEDALRADDPAQRARFTESLGDTPTLGVAFVAHFHIHPDVTPSIDLDGQAVSLTLKSNEVWVFRQEGGLLRLEDSVFLDQRRLKPRMTKQIVVMGRAVNFAGRISWSFMRAQDGGRNTRDIAPEDETT